MLYIQHPLIVHSYYTWFLYIPQGKFCGSSARACAVPR